MKEYSLRNLDLEDLNSCTIKQARYIYQELKKKNKEYVSKIDKSVQKLKVINLLQDKLIDEFGYDKLIE